MEKSPVTRASKIVLSNSRYRTLRARSLVLASQTVCVGNAPSLATPRSMIAFACARLLDVSMVTSHELLPAAIGGVWRKMPSLAA